MARWKILLLAVLGLGPFLFLMGAGSFHLWRTGWSFIAWWPMFLSLLAAYVLGWRWTRRTRETLLPNTATVEPLRYWTERDQVAWKLVEAKAAAVKAPTPEELTNAQRYADEAVSLATEIAQVYHPGTTDPFTNLTLPEVLTCAELVVGDLSTKVNKYLPGVHLFTIGHFRQAKEIFDIGQTAWNVTWLARILANPVNAGMQYLASKAGGTVLDRVQQNVMVWFHTAYLHELGRYLIELHSGRLKVGAARYRQLVDAPNQPVDDQPARSEMPIGLPSVSVAIIGQVKAGKSSLVNALLGEQRAGVDVVPSTTGETRYVWKTPGYPPMTLIDTAGYGLDGGTDAERAVAIGVASTSDLLIIVAHARSAARHADVTFLAKLRREFANQPQLKCPPMVLVLTHVDLLSPAMEWKPPYNWVTGTRTKEVSIREAAQAAREAMGEGITTIVPVCTALGKEWNVDDGLAEIMAATLNDAQGTAILRSFHNESRSGRAGRTVDQILNGGREAIKILWQNLK